MNKFMVVLVLTLVALHLITAQPQQLYAADSVAMNEQLSRKLRQHPVVKGEFEQLRNLAGIPRPIRSRGRFIYWRDHGLYWETNEPISQAATFTPNAIIHWQSATNLQQTERNSSPIQKQISRILLAVFGGDIKSLEQLFESRWSSGSKIWTVDLIPSIAAVKQVVEKISLSGEDYVNNLSLVASNGDATHIQFSNIRAFNQPGVDDCSYFEVETSLCRGEKADTTASTQNKP